MLHGWRYKSYDCHILSCLRLWGPKMLRPEGGETGWSSSPRLNNLFRCNTWQSANLTCFLKAELCLFLLYDLSFGKGFDSPSVARKLRWWHMRQRQELHLVAVAWAGSTPWAWGRIRQVGQSHPADRERRETNDNSKLGTVTHTVSFDLLQPCEMNILIPILQMWELQLREGKLAKVSQLVSDSLGFEP